MEMIVVKLNEEKSRLVGGGHGGGHGDGVDRDKSPGVANNVRINLII